MKIRILLADDHMVLRQGLTSLLRTQPNFEVVAEASDGASAVELARATRPDVVLMDIGMPGMDGIQATRIIHRDFPEIRIIGLTMFEEEELLNAMREAGAATCLTKSGSTNALIQAIQKSAAATTASAQEPDKNAVR